MKDKFTESFDELCARLEGKSLKAVMTAIYDEFDGLTETNVRDLVAATSSVKDLFEAQLAEAKKAWEDELAASGDDDDDVDEEELRKKIEEEIRKEYEEKWEKETKDLEEKFNEKLKTELEKAKKSKTADDEVKNLKKKHAGEIKELKEKHAGEIKELKEKHAEEIKELKEKHAEETKELEKKYAAKKEATADTPDPEEPSDTSKEVWVDPDGKIFSVKGCIREGTSYRPISKEEMEVLKKFGKVPENEKRLWLPLSKNPDEEFFGSYNSYLKSISD